MIKAWVLAQESHHTSNPSPPGMDTEIQETCAPRKSSQSPKELLYEACSMNQWWIHQMGIEADHIHVLIQIKPSDNVDEVVQILQGGSSRAIRKEFLELEEFLWGDSFWADGYFADSVGKVDEQIIRKYIREQGKPMP